MVALWTISLLALLVSHVAATGRQEARLAANLRTAAELEAAADGALHEAVFRMLDRPEDGLWRADGRPRRAAAPPGVEAEVVLESLDGKVNPNLAPAGLMAALLREAAGMGPDEAARLAVRVREWRAPGRFPRTARAQAEEYRAAGLGYGPPNAPFLDLDELGLVLGMTPEVLGGLRPHLSVHAPGAPDREAAGPAVRRAMAEAPDAGGGGDSGGHGGRRAVSVTAVASGAGGGRFVRRAVVALDAGAGRPWRVLALEDAR